MKLKCVMLKLNIKNWDKLLASINPADVYDDGDGYGLETTPHMTILYGIHPDTPNEALKAACESLGTLEVRCQAVEVFSNENFDVLKITVEKTPEIMKVRKMFTSEFYHINKFEEYNPHVTIAYLKKDKGEKYINPNTGKYFVSDTYWVTGEGLDEIVKGMG
jgi:hypothetical protein